MDTKHKPITKAENKNRWQSDFFHYSCAQQQHKASIDSPKQNPSPTQKHQACSKIDGSKNFSVIVVLGKQHQ
jgi:hypothetical protein